MVRGPLRWVPLRQPEPLRSEAGVVVRGPLRWVPLRQPEPLRSEAGVVVRGPLRWVPLRQPEPLRSEAGVVVRGPLRWVPLRQPEPLRSEAGVVVRGPLRWVPLRQPEPLRSEAGVVAGVALPPMRHREVAVEAGVALPPIRLRVGAVEAGVALPPIRLRVEAVEAGVALPPRSHRPRHYRPNVVRLPTRCPSNSASSWRRWGRDTIPLRGSSVSSAPVPAPDPPCVNGLRLWEKLALPGRGVIPDSAAEDRITSVRRPTKPPPPALRPSPPPADLQERWGASRDPARLRSTVKATVSTTANMMIAMRDRSGLWDRRARARASSTKGRAQSSALNDTASVTLPRARALAARCAPQPGQYLPVNACTGHRGRVRAGPASR